MNALTAANTLNINDTVTVTITGNDSRITKVFTGVVCENNCDILRVENAEGKLTLDKTADNLGCGSRAVAIAVDSTVKKGDVEAKMTYTLTKVESSFVVAIFLNQGGGYKMPLSEKTFDNYLDAQEFAAMLR